MDFWASIFLIWCWRSPSDAEHRFAGSAGQAIVSKTAAYLVTDSRYWLQAREELDPNWYLIPAGAVNAPKDWIEWLMVSGLQNRF